MWFLCVRIFWIEDLKWENSVCFMIQICVIVIEQFSSNYNREPLYAIVLGMCGITWWKWTATYMLQAMSELLLVNMNCIRCPINKWISRQSDRSRQTKVPKQPVDTGGGFLLEEDDTEPSPVNIVHPAR